MRFVECLHYKDAIGLRAKCASLRSNQIDIVHTHDVNRILAFRRWTGLEELLVVVSLSNHPYSGYLMEHPSITEGEWQAISNSDLAAYGGTSHAVLASLRVCSEAGSLTLHIPANSIIVLKRYE